MEHEVGLGEKCVYITSLLLKGMCWHGFDWGLEILRNANFKESFRERNVVGIEYGIKCDLYIVKI
jgi:hypothetical protein